MQTNIKTISGFNEYLPEIQLIENKYKSIIEKNYSLSGFTPLDTPAVERIETLKSKGDDNEIYGLFRLNGEETTASAELGLRFDLTVPLARYVALNEGVLSFPFKRQQIGKVYRGERPQKGRYREFYQADIDILGNGKLPLFSDAEIIYTIYNSLLELEFGKFVVNINNKKILVGFLESIGVEKVAETISVIDKKNKVKSIIPMLEKIGINKEQSDLILEYIELEKQDLKTIGIYLSKFKNSTLKEGIDEMQITFGYIRDLGVKKEYIKFNPTISRGLNYYTGMVFETFIDGYENFGSISSGGRYDNLCGQFTKNNYPGVGGSIGLSRLVALLDELKIIKPNKKTTSEYLIINTGKDDLKGNLRMLKFLRSQNVPAEIYPDYDTKIAKQIKYADNKNIPQIMILKEPGNELDKDIYNIKVLKTGEQSSHEFTKIKNKINKNTNS